MRGIANEELQGRGDLVRYFEGFHCVAKQEAHRR